MQGRVRERDSLVQNFCLGFDALRGGKQIRVSSTMVFETYSKDIELLNLEKRIAFKSCPSMK